MKEQATLGTLVRAGTVLFIFVVLPCIMMFSTSCAEVQTACQVVKAVDTACTMIEFVGDDGTVQQAPVSASDLKDLARTSAARRKDAGAKPVDNRDGG